MNSLDQANKLDELKGNAEGLGFGGRARDVRRLDQKSAVNMNVASAPLEWLAAKGMIETKDDEPGHGLVRFAIGMHIRRVVEGAQVAALKSQSFEGSSGGGAGARPVSDYKLDCMWQLDRIKSRMHPGLHRLLMMVVVDDVWLWETPTPMKKRNALLLKRQTTTSAKARKKLDRSIARERAKERRYIIGRVLKGLDHAGVALGYITYGQFRQRWNPRAKPKTAKKTG